MDLKEIKKPIFPENFLQSLVEFMNSETAYSVLLELIQERLNSSSCQIITKDAKSQKFVTRAITLELKEQEEKKNYSFGILEKCLKSGKSILIENPLLDEEINSNASITKFPFLSVIAIPIENDEGFIGAIYLDRRELNKGIFKERDQKEAEKIANVLIPIILKQEKLERDSQKLELIESGFTVGNSHKMKNLIEKMKVLATNNNPLLIIGENGVGKKFTAKMMHFLRHKTYKNFDVFQCDSPFPEKMGLLLCDKIQSVNGGTLVLDKITKLPENAQKILNYQMKEKRIVDSEGNLGEPLDIKFIFTSKSSLKRGEIIDDLFSKLKSHNLEIPPLRKRKGDTNELADAILEKKVRELKPKAKPKGFTIEAYQMLRKNPWEIRNIAQMEDVITSALQHFKAKDKKITGKLLFPNLEDFETYSDKFEDILAFILPELEGREISFDVIKLAIVKHFYTECEQNASKTAKKLKMGRSSLARLKEKWLKEL